MEIQEVTYSKYFGPVGKALWYSVENNYNEYLVYLKIFTSPQNGTTIQITNRWPVSSNPEYVEFFPPQPYGVFAERNVEIFHVPGFKSTDYVVINTPQRII